MTTESPADYTIKFDPTGHWPQPQNHESTGRILVLDSSFNPPTKAHIALLTTAVESFPENYFDACLLLFATKNADKQLTGASVDDRVAMMTLVARSFETRSDVLANTAVAVTPHSRFIDKAKALGFHAFFILGDDTVTRLFSPVYYDVPVNVALAPFFQRCELVCASRPGYPAMPGSHFEEKMHRIHLDKTIAELSSTLARASVTDEKIPLEHVVTDQVAKYIREHKLYT